jgi:hypothetical protein
VHGEISDEHVSVFSASWNNSPHGSASRGLAANRPDGLDGAPSGGLGVSASTPGDRAGHGAVPSPGRAIRGGREPDADREDTDGADGSPVSPASGGSKLFPAPCRRGESPPEVFFIAMLASGAMSE